MAGEGHVNLKNISGHLRICINYGRGLGAVCTRINCPFLHLCRTWLSGACLEENCLFSHDLNDEHNIKAFAYTERAVANAVKNLKCPENRREAIASSIPRLCVEYQIGKCTAKKGRCLSLHLCRDYMLGITHDHKQCKLNHNIRNAENNVFLKEYRLDPRKLESVIFGGILMEKFDPKHFRHCICYTARKQPLTEEAIANELYAFLCRRTGFALYADIVAGFAVQGEKVTITAEFLDREQIKHRFGYMMDDDDAEIYLIHVLLRSGERICYKYNVEDSAEQKSHKDDCAYLHVCRKWIANCCEENNCRRQHNFNDPRCVILLQQYGLVAYDEETVKNILQVTSPQVCTDYNEGCCVDTLCPYLHICNELVHGVCKDKCPNNKNHNPLASFCLQTIQRYQLASSKARAIIRLCLPAAGLTLPSIDYGPISKPKISNEAVVTPPFNTEVDVGFKHEPNGLLHASTPPILKAIFSPSVSGGVMPVRHPNVPTNAERAVVSTNFGPISRPAVPETIGVTRPLGEPDIHSVVSDNNPEQNGISVPPSFTPPLQSILPPPGVGFPFKHVQEPLGAPVQNQTGLNSDPRLASSFVTNQPRSSAFVTPEHGLVLPPTMPQPIGTAIQNQTGLNSDPRLASSFDTNQPRSSASVTPEYGLVLPPTMPQPIGTAIQNQTGLNSDPRLAPPLVTNQPRTLASVAPESRLVLPPTSPQPIGTPVQNQTGLNSDPKLASSFITNQPRIPASVTQESGLILPPTLPQPVVKPVPVSPPPVTESVSISPSVTNDSVPILPSVASTNPSPPSPPALPHKTEPQNNDGLVDSSGSVFHHSADNFSLVICEANIRLACTDDKDKCLDLHYPLPYLWRYFHKKTDKETDTPNLYDFGMIENIVIEREFCNPNKWQTDVFSPSDSLYICGVPSRVSINFAKMSMTSKPISGQASEASFCLLRLSTPSDYNARRSEFCSTQWEWFFCDELNNWNNLKAIDRDIPMLCESSFLSNGESVVVTNPSAKYTVDLHTMQFTRSTTADVFALKRRPVFVSPHGLASRLIKFGNGLSSLLQFLVGGKVGKCSPEENHPLPETNAVTKQSGKEKSTETPRSSPSSQVGLSQETSSTTQTIETKTPTTTTSPSASKNVLLQSLLTVQQADSDDPIKTCDSGTIPQVAETKPLDVPVSSAVSSSVAEATASNELKCSSSLSTRPSRQESIPAQDKQYPPLPQPAIPFSAVKQNSFSTKNTSSVPSVQSFLPSVKSLSSTAPQQQDILPSAARRTPPWSLGADKSVVTMSGHQHSTTTPVCPPAPVSQPDFWKPMVNDVELVRLSPDQPEHIAVMKQFRESMHRTNTLVSSIQRVQNSRLWAQYSASVTSLGYDANRQCIPLEKNTSWRFFYQCSVTQCDIVCNAGFLSAKSVPELLHISKYLPAEQLKFDCAYFSTDASVLYECFSQQPQQACFVLFLCLLPSALTNVSSVNRLPESLIQYLPQSGSSPFCLSATQFANNLFYPQYVITYAKQLGADNNLPAACQSFSAVK